MNTWPLVVGLFTLSACADPATPQQPPRQSQDVAGRSMPSPPLQSKKLVLPKDLSQQKVDEETEMNLEEATRKINEIDQRLEYLRRYIGPGPNK